ncbi:MAG: hypothetical protein CVT59_04570 [Actinobacteria bacterium HGW-Actinobacteria-1]|nr:MAG: hypothetical protein CVT59_04570 [Actinobacteria bacterium HGW-Actinobacteria-1]
MASRKSVLLIGSVVAIAAASFLLGSYVFPHAASRVPNQDSATPPNSSAATDSDGLASFGIDVSASSDASQTPDVSSGSATTGGAALDDATLASLDSPAQGFLIGRVTASGDPTRTAEVRVDVFRIALTAEDGSLSTYTLPAGTSVQLFFDPARTGPGPNAQTVPEQGASIQANVRVEPATNGTPARIRVVNVQIMGSPQ